MKKKSRKILKKIFAIFWFHPEHGGPISGFQVDIFGDGFSSVSS